MRAYVLHWLDGFLPGGVANALAPTWFMCIGIAGLAGLVAMLVVARRRGLDRAAVASAVMWGYVAAVLAGILVPMLITGFEHALATGRFQLRWSGMTSFWGYLGGALAVVVVCDREGIAYGRFADAAVIPLGITLVFARLGCFMAGCDYGQVTSVPWAVRFPAGSPAWRDHVHAGLIPANSAQSLAVHPTQLYEAMLGIVIVVVGVLVARRRRRPDGDHFLAAAATYAIGRLFIETLRGDAGRGIYAGVSSGQIFCAIVLVAIAARWFVAKRRAVVAVAAAALVLTIANVGEADAQPVPAPATVAAAFEPPVANTASPADAAGTDAAPADALSQPSASSADSADSIVPIDQVAAPPPLRRRPPFSVGLLFGAASPLNRRSDQVPTLAGATLSFGYVPGRFGLWVDADAYSNSEASHNTLMASVSFAPRITSRLWLGARAGVGVTSVNFKDPAFQDVTGKTVRVEALAEFVLGRHWTLWCRPLAIDMLDAPDLGGPITTIQFRFGVSYRFGQRGDEPPGAQ